MSAGLALALAEVPPPAPASPPAADAAFPLAAFFVLGLPLVLPSIGVGAAILLAVRPRVAARGEWRLAMAGVVALPFLILYAVVRYDVLTAIAGSGFAWMGIFCLWQLVYTGLWWWRWRPESSPHAGSTPPWS